jgi:phosphoenolpyruvate carboxylase
MVGGLFNRECCPGIFYNSGGIIFFEYTLITTAESQLQHEALRADVRLLGNLLGETIREHHEQNLFNLIEEVRGISKEARRGDSGQTRKLIELLSTLKPIHLLNLARAFTLFLNLANIAEQHHQIRERRLNAANQFPGSPGSLVDGEEPVPAGFIEADLAALVAKGISRQTLYDQVCSLNIDLILTAHPTEILRRSVSSKFLRIARLLSDQDRPDLSRLEKLENIQALHRAVVEVWETDEIRRVRPTPLDEAKTGLVTLEHSLWDVVPNIMRELDHGVTSITGKSLPLDCAPVRFGSWMGGDRDGNPNTTPQVTSRVCALNRLKAAELFWREIDELRRDLSMVRCNDSLRQEVGKSALEPYRSLLESVQAKLRATIICHAKAVEEFTVGIPAPSTTASGQDPLLYRDELLQPLLLCHRSLVDCGDATIAEGRLTDIIRRIYVFGLNLFKLDIRQEADRHTETLNAITEFLDLGSYAAWDEPTRQEFLLKELQSNRPLIAFHGFNALGRACSGAASERMPH